MPNSWQSRGRTTSDFDVAEVAPQATSKPSMLRSAFINYVVWGGETLTCNSVGEGIETLSKYIISHGIKPKAPPLASAAE